MGIKSLLESGGDMVADRIYRTQLLNGDVYEFPNGRPEEGLRVLAGGVAYRITSVDSPQGRFTVEAERNRTGAQLPDYLVLRTYETAPA